MNNEKIIEAFCRSEKVSAKEKHEFGLWCAELNKDNMEDPTRLWCDDEDITVTWKDIHLREKQVKWIKENTTFEVES